MSFREVQSKGSIMRVKLQKLTNGFLCVCCQDTRLLFLALNGKTNKWTGSPLYMAGIREGCSFRIVLKAMIAS